MSKVHDEFCTGSTPCTCPESATAIDGRSPTMREHLCARDLHVRPGPVEECCEALWLDEGVDTS